MNMLNTPTVKIYFEDEEKIVPKGISVAAAVLGHIHAEYTTIHALAEDHRAPYCMMGVCHECLMEINGVHNVQACITIVEEGMRIYRGKKLSEDYLYE